MDLTPHIAALMLVLPACGDVAGVPAALGEVCGVEAPVRLLELAPDQVALDRPQRIGERLFYNIGRPDAKVPTRRVPATDLQLWTTGLCGEAPMRLDDQFTRVFELERWPGLALAVDHAGNIMSLAPTGPLAPHQVFPAGDCEPQWSAQGMLTCTGLERPALVFYRYPDDPRRETGRGTSLWSNIRMRGQGPAIDVRGDHLFFRRNYATDLISIDLRDGAVRLEQTGVDRFTVSPSGRYVAWQVLRPPQGDLEEPIAITTLHDRETGLGAYLGELIGRPTLQWAEQGFVTLELANGERRIHRLPGLEHLVLPEHYLLDWDLKGDFQGPLADGRWVLRSTLRASLHYLDPVTGLLAPMISRHAQVLAHEPDGALVLGVFPCCGTGNWSTWADEGPVWLFPPEGEARLLAARSTLFAWRPRPDLLATLLDVRGDRRGTLMLVDTATQDEFVVDEHVFATHLKDPAEPDILRYTVQDGARSGVWQVRLPP